MFTSLFEKTNNSQIAFIALPFKRSSYGKKDYNLMDVIKRPCENEKIGDHISDNTDKL